MPAFPRDELDTVVQRWLQANRDAETIGDWRDLAAFYTDGASYGWTSVPKRT